MPVACTPYVNAVEEEFVLDVDADLRVVIYDKDGPIILLFIYRSLRRHDQDIQS